MTPFEQGKRIRYRRTIPGLVPRRLSDRRPKEEWIQKGESPNIKVHIRIRLRRPRNDSLGALSGRGMRRCQRARRAHRTGNCYVVLLIHHTVDEPPLIANIGGHCALRERRWQKPHATYATRVTLTAPEPFISPSLSSETSCTAQSEQSLGSARRAPARIRDCVVLNHAIRCLHRLLLREATCGTARGPSMS